MTVINKEDISRLKSQVQISKLVKKTDPIHQVIMELIDTSIDIADSIPSTETTSSTGTQAAILKRVSLRA